MCVFLHLAEWAGFEPACRSSRQHDFSIVLVYKFDRFSRNKYETTKHKKTLKDNGVKVVSATEYIPDSPEAIILESMIEGFEQANGHNRLKKINSEFKAAISM